jgi:hypothetical protein
LRYGMFETDVKTTDSRYRPFIEKFRGKQWIFYPQALELPKNTEGNIFRLTDGSVMITMVSAWRHLRKVEGFDSNLEVICRLPDAASMNNVQISSVDLGESSKVEPQRNGNTLKITVPKHAKATVILLSHSE